MGMFIRLTVDSCEKEWDMLACCILYVGLEQVLYEFGYVIGLVDIMRTRNQCR